MKTVAFFWHRLILKSKEVKIRLLKEIEEKVKLGYTHFLVGRHGEFDNLSLSVISNYKKNVASDINIEIVLTSLSNYKKENYSAIDSYIKLGCKTLIYDIEEVHFKNRIIVTNKKMVDESDLIICYLDHKRQNSGARRAVEYALKQGKDVINLYREEDKIFDFKNN